MQLTGGFTIGTGWTFTAPSSGYTGFNYVTMLVYGDDLVDEVDAIIYAQAKTLPPSSGKAIALSIIFGN
jgi:hypothetical protein